MTRSLALACLLVFLPTAVFAQSGAVSGPVCKTKCEEVCTGEDAQRGCNVAVGLTACRVRHDRCVSVCARKCPRS
ncbi:MAG: hypothetical protein JWL62_3085 [Hyphomicrobiales bacterium]|nr:hypothetical protein [Hyphomicrobiales bacterium]